MLDNIDFNKLAQEMIRRKLLGEAKSDVFSKNMEFDIRDYLGGAINLDPSALKKNATKNLDISLLEEMFAELRVPNDLKATITNFNNALGIVVSPEGEVEYMRETDTGMEEINAGPVKMTQAFDGLVIAGILRTLVQYEPSVAGTLFEKIVAGLLQGFHMGGQNSFEDVISQEGGQKFSVKLLNPETPIEGSVAAMAVNVGASGAMPVDFVIGQKSHDKLPYTLKFARFSIDRKNFFKFVAGGKQKPVEVMQDLLTRIRVKPNKDSRKNKLVSKGSYSISWVLDNWQTSDNFTRAFEGFEWPDRGVILNDVNAFFDFLGELEKSGRIHIEGTKLDQLSGEEDLEQATVINNKYIVLNPQVIETQAGKIIQTHLKNFAKIMLKQRRGSSTTADSIAAAKTEISRAIVKLRNYSEEWWQATPGAKEFSIQHYIEPEKQEEVNLASTGAQIAGLMNSNYILSKIWEFVQQGTFPEDTGFLAPKSKPWNDPQPGVNVVRQDSSPVKKTLTGKEGIRAAYTILSEPKFMQDYTAFFDLKTKIIPALDNSNTQLSEKERAFFNAIFGEGTPDARINNARNNLLNPTDAIAATAANRKLSEAAVPGLAAEPKEDMPVGKSTFSMKIKRIIENASDYGLVTDIPAIVLSKDMINKNAQNRNTMFLDTITPIFETFHNIRVGLLRFYSGGEVTGLSTAKTKTEELGKILSEVPENFSQGQMNENKALTNENIDAILDLL